MTEKCLRCGKSDEREPGTRSNMCVDCWTPREFGVPKSIERVFLNGYGYVSRNRLNEMKRRRVLPDKPTEADKDYYIGRMGENGKVEEKEPTY